MNDNELHEIVKKHPKAWPKDVVLDSPEWGEPMFAMYGLPIHFAELMFEAAFHRELMHRGDVFTHHLGNTYTVQMGDHDFSGSSLIEAYAKALEWLE